MVEWKDKLVLVVDDDDMLRSIARESLENKGYKVVEASDSIECFDRLNQALPQVVLLDVHMPRVDGITILKKIRSNEATKDLVVIMLTADRNEDMIVRAAQHRANGYLVKPFSPKELVDYIHSKVFKVDFNIIRDILDLVSHKDDQWFSESKLKDFNLKNWSAYRVEYRESEICVVARNEVDVHNLSNLTAQTIRENIILFIRDLAGWRRIWPTSKFKAAA